MRDCHVLATVQCPRELSALNGSQLTARQKEMGKRSQANIFHVCVDMQGLFGVLSSRFGSFGASALNGNRSNSPLVHSNWPIALTKYEALADEA